MKYFRQARTLVLLLLLLPITGCLFRSRKVERVVSNQVIYEATKEELVERINSDATRIQTLNLTVDIDTDVGGQKKGKVTEYQQVRGYILVRKPSWLRMIGLVPVVRSRAFDMVSDGVKFMLSIPSKSRFLIGHNEVVHPSKNALENIRPQHIFEALLQHEVDPKDEIAVVEEGTEMLRDSLDKKKQVVVPTYVVTVIHRGDKPSEGWYLARKIVFSREDLQPHEQIVYDKAGNIATDAHYEAYTNASGIMFPQQIRIWRPQEEYSITLSVIKMRVNEPLKDDQFALAQPPDAQVVDLDQPKPEPGQGLAPPATPKNEEHPRSQGDASAVKPTS
jgi:outer membrane lipoprotein-sorting protein